jgi:hypothetical protein
MSGNSKKSVSLLERLEQLEFAVGRVQGVEGLALNLRKSMTTVVEMVNSMVEVVGAQILGEGGGKKLAEQISASMDDKRAQVRRSEAERSAAYLQKLIDDGQVEAAETVDAETIIAGTENSLDGRIKGEKLYMNATSFPQDMFQEMTGKGVGYAVVREGITVFTIDAIYKMKPVEPQKLTDVPAEATPETPAGEQAPQAAVGEIVPPVETTEGPTTATPPSE